MPSEYNKLVNAAPYYDDFDPKLNFVRILFTPSRAVQARELTQLQSILHHQSNQVADHLFKEKTPITGGHITVKMNQASAVLKPYSYNSSGTIVTTGVENDPRPITSDIEDFKRVTFNDKVQDESGNLVDGVKQITVSDISIITASGPGAVEPSSVIYYEFAGDNIEQGEFYYSDTLGVGFVIEEAVNEGSTSILNVTGSSTTNPFLSMAAYCEDGVIYAQKHFSVVQEESIIASNQPKSGFVEIGYLVKQEIIDENSNEMVPADILDQDGINSIDQVQIGTKLRDPARGSRNFNAPGAHRYRIQPRLFAIQYADASLREQVLASTTAESEDFVPILVYEDGNLIREQSGPDYGDILNLLARRTYDESGNYTVDDFDLSLFALENEPGDPNPVADPQDKFVLEIGPGKAYVKGYEIKKSSSTGLVLDRSRGEDYKLRRPARSKRLPDFPSFVLSSTGDNNTLSAGGGANSGWFDFGRQEKVYLINRAIDDPNSLGFVDGNVTYGGNNVTEGSTHCISIFTEGDMTFFYIRDLGDAAEEIKNLRAIVSYREDTGEFAWANMALALDSRNNRRLVPMFSGSESTMIVPLSSSVIDNVNMTSYNITMVEKFNVTYSAGKATIATGGSFRDRRPVVAAINASDPSQIFDVSALGQSITTDGTVEISNIPGEPSSLNMTVYVAYESPHGGRTTKTLQEKTISFHQVADRNEDVIEFPETDIYDVTEIVQYEMENLNAGGGPEDWRPISTNENGYKFTTDDMLKLEFDTGQRDTYITNGSIKGLSKFWARNRTSMTPGVRVAYTIKYRHFSVPVDNDGVVTLVNSYKNAFNDDLRKIPSYQSEKFGRFDLVSCLDFRQVVGRNPHLTIAPGSLVYCDYDEYIGRYDVVYLNKKGEFGVKTGIPSLSPKPPTLSDDSMKLCTLFVPPYTFTTRDIELKTEKNTRYTMKDISRLENRIERVEETVSLSLLEQNALDMRIIDQNSGFDKFKSGIFVDDFDGLSHTNTNAPEFYIAVDQLERSIKTPIKEFNIPLEYNTSLSSGVANNYNNLITISPESTRILAQNKTATSTVNLNPYLFYTWNGTIELSPSIDTWRETRYMPNVNVTVGSHQAPAGFNPDWTTTATEVNWSGIQGSDPEPPSPPRDPGDSNVPDVLPSGSPPVAPQLDPRLRAIDERGRGATRPPTPRDGIRQTDIAFSSDEMREFMRLLADPAADQARLQELAEFLSDDWDGRRGSLEGAAAAARNIARRSGGNATWDIDEALIDSAINMLEGNEVNTASNLGSDNVLSASEARGAAMVIGARGFDSLRNTTGDSSLSEVSAPTPRTSTPRRNNTDQRSDRSSLTVIRGRGTSSLR